MKNKRRKTVSLLMIGLLLICALAALVEMRFNMVQRVYDNLVMDNRNHYLPCEDLPARDEVQRIVNQHTDVIQQIQQIDPGFVGVEIDSITCAGKADLVIWYGTHQQRVAIEKMIGGDTFFGIPYRLQNR